MEYFTTEAIRSLYKLNRQAVHQPDPERTMHQPLSRKQLVVGTLAQALDKALVTWSISRNEAIANWNTLAYPGIMQVLEQGYVDKTPASPAERRERLHEHKAHGLFEHVAKGHSDLVEDVLLQWGWVKRNIESTRLRVEEEEVFIKGGLDAVEELKARREAEAGEVKRVKEREELWRAEGQRRWVEAMKREEKNAGKSERDRRREALTEDDISRMKAAILGSDKLARMEAMREGFQLGISGRLIKVYRRAERRDRKLGKNGEAK